MLSLHDAPVILLYHHNPKMRIEIPECSSDVNIVSISNIYVMFFLFPFSSAGTPWIPVRAKRKKSEGRSR